MFSARVPRLTVRGRRWSRSCLVLPALALTVALGTTAGAQNNYSSFLFGTNSQNEGDFSGEATALNNALLNWGNWQTANKAGRVTVEDKDKTITQALTDFSGTAAANNDFVLFLYDGHGGKFADGNEGPPALDMPDERVSTYKNVGGWTRARDTTAVTPAFKGVNANAYKLAIFSSCYSGGMWGGPSDLNSVANTFMYGSSTELQKTPAQDPFLAALTSSMADGSADLNKDGKVTVSEWFTRANALVKAQNPTYFYPNSPSKDDMDSPPDDITATPVYFTGSASTDQLVVAYNYNPSMSPAVPEPSPRALLVLGLVPLALCARCRRQR